MARNKWNTDSVRCYLKENGYTLITNEYKDNKQKLEVVDEEGYRYTTKLSNFLNGHPPRKFDASNPHSIENLKLWLVANNKNYHLINAEYPKIHGKVELKDVDGYIWTIELVNLLSGKEPIRFDKSNKYTIDNINLWIELNDKDFKLLSDVYKNSKSSMDFKCTNELCNEIFHAEWNKIYQGRGCPYCSGRKVGASNCLASKYPELIEEWDYERNEISPYEVTSKSAKKVWWICKECNNGWDTHIHNRTNGSGCPLCNSSKGEKKISKWLIDNGISFIPQKTFDNLYGLGGSSLSYDFYIPDLNILIEYQGQQHEKYYKGFHKTEWHFFRQLEHDNRKRTYAISNKIKLLEIWYWDFDNIDKILKEELL